MTLDELNALPAEEAERVFLSLCGSSRWARRMAEQRPYASRAELEDCAEDRWRKLEHHDWIEAFSHHPRIGDRTATGAPRTEQSGMARAPAPMLREFERLNRLYEEKFGFVFLIFASGKTAEEMLDALETRILNHRDVELKNAVDEQAKITRVRLAKLLETADPSLRSG